MAEAHTTGWRCEVCGAQGTLPHPADVDVYTMVNRVSDAHREASPDCTSGLEKVRVWKVAP